MSQTDPKHLSGNVVIHIEDCDYFDLAYTTRGFEASLGGKFAAQICRALSRGDALRIRGDAKEWLLDPVENVLPPGKTGGAVMVFAKNENVYTSTAPSNLQSRTDDEADAADITHRLEENATLLGPLLTEAKEMIEALRIANGVYEAHLPQMSDPEAGEDIPPELMLLWLGQELKRIGCPGYAAAVGEAHDLLQELRLVEKSHPGSRSAAVARIVKMMGPSWGFHRGGVVSRDAEIHLGLSGMEHPYPRRK